MKKILYPAYIEKGNLGDILINCLLVRELSKSNEVYLKGTPNIDLQKLITQNNSHASNINIINLKSTKSFQRKVAIFNLLLKKERFDYVFDTPGHITRKTSNLKTLLKAVFDLLKIITYRIFGVKSVKFGITLGPFKPIEWAIYRYICNSSSLICVRDSENYKQLKEKHFKNIDFAPDLAFLLVENPDLIVPPFAKKQSTITISLRGSIYGKNEDVKYLNKILEKTKELLRIIMENNNNAITTINLAYQVDCDQQIFPRIEQMLKENFSNLLINIHQKQLTINSAQNLYSSSSYVITNRLHVFLFAMLLKTKTFIVTDNKNHQKLNSILADLNLSSFIFEESEPLFSKLNDDLDLFYAKAVRNKEEIIKKISSLV